MPSLNKVMLIGNLGRDPEVRFTPDGAPVASFSLATSESWTDKNGARQERTEWHNIVAWNKLADLAKRYLAKGRPVYVEGRIRTREWDDRDGNKRRTTEIIATQMVLLGSRPQGTETGTTPQAVQRNTQDVVEPVPDPGAITDEDIPF